MPGIGGIPSEQDIERAAQGGARQWDDGTYTIVGLKWFDDEQHTSGGEPIYVPQQGELVARGRLIVKGEDDGPPISLRPGQVVPLVKALGGDVGGKWPDAVKNSSNFLREAERRVEKSDKETEVTVNGGWVSDVPGWSLPRDQSFQFIYEGCYSKDDEGNPTWNKYQYGRSVIFGFKVIGDLDGTSTPYNGWVERVFVPYRLAPNPKDPSMPDFVIDEEDDGNNTNQVNCFNLMKVMAPDLLNNEDWEDADNIVPEWDKFAKEAKIILRGDTIWSKRAKKVKLPIWTLKQRYPDGRSYEGAEEPVPVQEEEVIEKSPAIEYVYKAVTEEVRKRSKDEKAKAFGPDGKLNKAGVEIAKEFFTPLINEKSLPGNVFAEWETEHCVTALVAMGYKDLARMVEGNQGQPPNADF